MIKQHPSSKLIFARYLCILWVYLSILPVSSSAQVWNCAEGYTNKPQGKTDCKKAGAGAVCAKDGKRYFAPDRGTRSINQTSTCSGQSVAQNGFLIDETLKEVSDAKNALYNKVATSIASAKKYFSNRSAISEENSKLRVGDPQYEDLFSCFARGAGFGECSIAELHNFVENTVLQAGDALR
jgi:hypothetical protein